MAVTAGARVQGPGGATVSGATAARAIAYSVTSGSAKMAEAGLKKMKSQQVINSAKSTVTTSNQRVVATAPTVAKGVAHPTPQDRQTVQTPQPTQVCEPPKKIVAAAQAPALAPAVAQTPKEEPVKKEDPRPIDELLDFIEGSSNTQAKTTDSKKAAKKARQKLKKLEQQKEEENLSTKTPDVTITMLKDSSETAKGRKGAGKQEVISTIPSATAQSIRDRIKSQVGEVAKKMGTSDQPQMVTIRRVMEPNSSEPTVTITLKGATPDKDKVLFTLVNGQNEVVCHDQAGSQPKSKKQRKLERRLLRKQQQQQIQVEERVEVEEEEEEEPEEEEIDLSSLTKTQRKKLRRLQRKQEEERLAEEQRQREEEERIREEEERLRKENAERLKQQKGKKNSKKDKAQNSQAQSNNKQVSKSSQKGQLHSEPSSSKTASKSSKVNSAPDSDDEFVVPVQMTKKERKKARVLQQQLEEELRRQRQKEEEERERLRQIELKEQKKKQKELQKVKQQQQKQQEKQQQKQKEQEKKQQKQSQTKSQQQQQQQQQKQKQKQPSSKQQQPKVSKQGGKITTSIISNAHSLGNYMPPVGSLEWTTQALAASRPNVTIQPAGSTSSSLGGLEQRFSTTLTLNGKPIIPPPRQASPEPAQDFSLENLKLPPGITITKVDPSQVQQRKPPVSKPQVTKTVVSNNPAPTTIIAAPLSNSRPPNTYNSGGGQDPNSNVIVVDTGKLKQDIAKREEQPEQVVTRKKKNNKNKKGVPEPASRPQVPSQLPPYLYGMNSVSITPAGQAAPNQPAPPPPQAAIIKMNGNMVTIRNPAIHPTPQRYIGPDVGEKESGNSRKAAANSGQSTAQNRNKDNSNLPPRFANAKLSQQTNGVNGYVPDFNSARHRSQHYDAAPQTYEVPKPHKHHYETPPRHFESRHYEAARHFDQATHFDGGALHFESSACHYDTGSHHYDTVSRQFETPTHHFDHSGRHFDSSAHSFEHAGRHFESASHHFDHSGLHCDQSAHHYNPPIQQKLALGMHDKHTKHMHPQNYAAAIEGKKTKLKNAYNNDDWQLLDSVFAPKDIDLDDGDIDDDERELEAFKRFCLQSVPPKRKEKVHLNIEDIVLKKKSSPVSCT